MVLQALSRRLPRSIRPVKPKQPRRRLFLERLEDRITPTTVDLGPLRFSGDFSNVGNNYSASGTVELGLVPTQEEAYNPLVDINGSVAFTVGTSDPTFTVTSAHLVTTVQPPPDAQPLDLWDTTGAFAFNVKSLTTTGVSLTGANTIQVNSTNFTLNNLLLANPGGSTTDAQIQLQGNLTLQQLVGLNVAVNNGNYVSIDSNGVHLTDFTTPVTTTTTVFGLSLAPNDLNFSYTSNNQTFSLGGDVILSTSDGGLTGVAANLGTINAPGLTVQNGLVQQAQITIKNDFQLFGLNFSPNGPLTLQYAGGNQLTASGSLKTTLPQPLGSVLDATLGTADQPGLVITNGQVRTVTISVTGSVVVFGLGMKVDSATIQLTGPNQYELSGQFDIPVLFFATVSLPIGSGIKIDNGKLHLDGLTLRLQDVPLGAFWLSDITVGFSDSNGTIGVTAGCTVWFPGEFSLAATIGLVDGKLNDISINYHAMGENPGVEMADTGLFLVGMNGSLQNLDHPKDIIVSASVIVNWGEKFEL
jgi:hypothetical protein